MSSLIKNPLIAFVILAAVIVLIVVVWNTPLKNIISFGTKGLYLAPANLPNSPNNAPSTTTCNPQNSLQSGYYCSTYYGFQISWPPERWENHSVERSDFSDVLTASWNGQPLDPIVEVSNKTSQIPLKMAVIYTSLGRNSFKDTVDALIKSQQQSGAQVYHQSDNSGNSVLIGYYYPSNPDIAYVRRLVSNNKGDYFILATNPVHLSQISSQEDDDTGNIINSFKLVA